MSDASDTTPGVGCDRTWRDDSPAVDDLAVVFGALARSMQGAVDVQGTLDAIVHAAVRTVPGARHASISTVQDRRHFTTQAATSDFQRAVDQAQYDVGQGPCLDALLQQRAVRSDDPSSTWRWPAFAARGRTLGVGSMLCVQLYVDGHRGELGALNLSSEESDAFTDQSAEVALVLAAHAAVAMFEAQSSAQMRSAVDNRDLIGMAKGVLVERYKVTPGAAFDVLARASQHTNRKLLDVALELVEAGTLATGSATRSGRPRAPQQRQRS